MRDPALRHVRERTWVTPEQAQILERWVEQGAPEGEGEDPLAATRNTDRNGHWPNPDLVVNGPKAAANRARGVFD